MEEINTLKKLGLSENEARMYLILLELGSVKAGILMKKLNMYSKTTYELLNKLIEKGLVSYILKANIKYYNAVDPERFIYFIKEKMAQLHQTEYEIEKILPILKQTRKTDKESQEANIYIGKEGMKSVFDDILKQDEEILVFGGGGKFKETLGPYSEHWHKKRKKKRISLKILWNKKLRQKRESTIKYGLVTIKFLPREFENPAPAVIYGNKIAITIFSETPMIILIRSKEVAKSYRGYFNMLWRIAKP